MSHQHATIEDTVYFWFGSNDTSGSGADGASPVYDVREAGAAAGAIPLLSGSATLLSHANFPPGCHEIAVAATVANGFAANDTFAVFCTLLVDSQNPTGFVGSCTLTPLAKTSELQSKANDALVALSLDHLIAVADADDVVDDSIIAKLAAKGGTAVWTDYVNTTDSHQAIRDAITDANPQNHAATANNETTGTLDAGTYADTATINMTYYQTSPVTPAVGGFGLNVDLTFSVGVGRVAEALEVTGYFGAAAQRSVHVWAYDYNLATYVQVSDSSTDFNNAAANQTFQYTMTNNMRQASDGEVKIRFTSTSTTVGDNWFCDAVIVSSVAQEAAGLTADAIQHAVWARTDTDHDEDTLGYNLSKTHILHGDISSATNANQFILDSGVAVNDAYNGMLITLEDKTDNHYELRRIVDYIGATNEIFVDRDLGFTPVAGDEFYIMNGGYADVNTTHIGATVQTALDINDILDDTNELQTNQGDWATATGFSTHSAENVRTEMDSNSTELAAIKGVTDALTAAAATKLALSAGTIVVGTVSHDNSAATTTVFYSDDITEATADHFNGRIVIFTSGALQFQASDITDYELSAGEGTFTVTALTEAPADNVTFIIV